MNTRVTLASLLVATSAFASAQLDLGTTDASDGVSQVFPGNGLTFNLAEAATGTWNSPAPVPGKGVYDPQLWAVVYKFSSINWQENTVISFVPHPSGCPVIFLSQGNVTINTNFTLPYFIGGFGGGQTSQTSLGSGGLGPGGGSLNTVSGLYGGNGSYATSSPASNPHLGNGQVYGNPAILPLIGGSGGGTSQSVSFGGAGGSAILIASRETFTFGGYIGAPGQSLNGVSIGGSGSGGAIKLMGQTFNSAPGANLVVSGGTSNVGVAAGEGRIRIEANTFGTLPSSPNPISTATAGPVAKIFATNLTPKVTISKVGGISAPTDSRGTFNSPPDVNLNAPGSQTVEVTCENVPVNGTWSVFVRGVPRNGQDVTYTATYATGNLAWSTWTVNVPFTEGNQVLQVRAKKN